MWVPMGEGPGAWWVYCVGVSGLHFENGKSVGMPLWPILCRLLTGTRVFCAPNPNLILNSISLPAAGVAAGTLDSCLRWGRGLYRQVAKMWGQSQTRQARPCTQIHTPPPRAPSPGPHAWPGALFQSKRPPAFWWACNLTSLDPPALFSGTYSLHMPSGCCLHSCSQHLLFPLPPFLWDSCPRFFSPRLTFLGTQLSCSRAHCRGIPGPASGPVISTSVVVPVVKAPGLLTRHCCPERPGAAGASVLSTVQQRR